MYKFVALFALIAIASAARIRRDSEPVAIVKSDSDFSPDGSYSFSFEGADGQARSENGVVHNAGEENAFVAVSGSYRYTDTEGVTHEVTYTADENGFVPTGGNIPEAIVKGVRAAIDAVEKR